MKKIFALLLVLVAMLAVFTSCLDTYVEKIIPGTFEDVNTDDSEEMLESARKYLYQMYKDEAVKTPSDYKVVAKVMIGEKTFSVTWSVKTPAGKEDQVQIGATEKSMVTIDVADEPAEEVAYTLVATISDGEKSVTVEFNHILPAYHVAGFDEFVAAEKGDSVVVSGIVSGVISKTNGNTYNCLYVQGDKGGYYVYNMADDPVVTGIKVGQTVKITGLKDVYSGTYEIANATVVVIDETIQEITPVDYTEKYKNASALTDADLNYAQAMLVTIKGVEITGIGSDASYYTFKLGELTSYVRISSSACPIVLEKDTFINEYNSHIGYIADVTGIICQYSGAFYLTPATVDAIKYISLPEKTDAEAVAFEKEKLAFTNNITADGEFTLGATGATYSKVSVAWALDAEYAFASIAEGKLTVTLPEESQTIKLTATLTAGEATETKEFEILVDAVSADLYIPEKITAPAEGTFKYALYQANLGKYLYLTGEKDGYKLAVTDKPAKGADVVIAAVEGGYTLCFNGKYLELAANDKNVDANFVDEVTGKWTWNTDLGMFTWNVEGCTNASKNGENFLGTYKTYETVTASSISYISGTKAADLGVSQFCAYASTLAPAMNYPVFLTEAKEGTFKFGFYQANLGKFYYLTGEKDSWKLATTDNADKACDAVVAAVEGGYTLCFNGKYLELAANGSNVDLNFVDEATGKWTWNIDLGMFTWNVEGCTNESKNGETFLGAYKTYETVTASSTSYISGEKAADLDVSQFAVRPANITLKKVAPVAITAPTAGTYKFAVNQLTLGKYLYLTGEKDTWRLATTDRISKAADCVLAETEGGYTICVAGKYLELSVDGGNVNMDFVETATGKWTWDETLGMFTWNVEGCTKESKNGPTFLGTYGTYPTIVSSSTSYITGEKAADLGVSQYALYLSTIEFVKDVEPTAEEKIAAEKKALTVATSVTAAGDIEVATKGKTHNDVTITWSSDNTAIIAVDGGKLTVTLPTDQKTDVVLTATLTCGEATDTATFTVSVAKEGEGPIVDLSKLALTRTNLFPGLSGTGYATYDGDHKVGTYTVTTSNVLGNVYGNASDTSKKPNVLQFKKLVGSLSVTGKFASVKLVLLYKSDSKPTSFDNDPITVKVGNTAKTIDWTAVLATCTEVPDNTGYYAFTIEVALDDKTESTITIVNETGYARYFSEIKFY